MSWNYRVYRHVEIHNGQEHTSYKLHDSYYPEGETEIPNGVSLEAATPDSDDLEGLRWQLEKMLAALQRPVLDYDKIGADLVVRQGCCT